MQVEDLLETNFMRMDHLHTRLALLKERIEDQEDEINIRLDHRCALLAQHGCRERC